MRRTVMLVLSRKPQEHIVVGGTIRITLMAMRAQEVWIGIEAPEELSIVCEDHSASAIEPTDEAPGGDPTGLACRDPLDLLRAAELAVGAPRGRPVRDRHPPLTPLGDEASPS